MFRKPVRVGLAATAAALIVASSALGSDHKSASVGHASKKSLTIGLVYGALTNPFFLKAEAGAKAEAAKLGVKVTVTGGQDYTQPEETTALKTLLAAHPSGLAVAPVDPNGVVPSLKEYQAAGIPIATYDSTAAPHSVPLVLQVTTANYDEGVAAAKKVAALIHGSGDVAIINLSTSVGVLVARINGFEAEIKKSYPKIHVVAVENTGGNDPSVPLSQTETLINKYGSSLKAIFTTFNVATEATAQGVDQAGKKGKVIVAGSDGDQALYKLVENGSVQILFQQQAAQEGAMAVKALVTDLRGGRKTNPAQVLQDVLVTPQNVKKMGSYEY